MESKDLKTRGQCCCDEGIALAQTGFSGTMDFVTDR